MYINWQQEMITVFLLYHRVTSKQRP